MSGRPTILFRTTAGSATGLGHLRRCLSLAQAAKCLGASSVFAVDGDRDALHTVAAAGFAVTWLQADWDAAETVACCRLAGAELIVLDSYDFSSAFVTAVVETGVTAALIDDLERDFAVDLVINPSPDARPESYAGKPGARFLVGPRYALLRPEFARPPRRIVAGNVTRALVTLGGSDPRGLTGRVLEWTCRALPHALVDVVVGPLAHGEDRIQAAGACADRVSVHRDPPNMRELMESADVAVSGGGQTLYELAAMGTPTVGIRLAANQTGNLEGFARRGTLLWAGDAEDASLARGVDDALRAIGANRECRQSMSAAGQRLVDGQGARRAAEALLAMASLPAAAR